MPDANMLFKLSAPASIGTGVQNALAGQAALNKFAMQPTQNALVEAQAGAYKAKNEESNELMKLREAAFDAQNLLPVVKAGDLQRASQMMDARIERVKARGGDPSDTMRFRDQLISGAITPDQAVAQLTEGATRAWQQAQAAGALVADKANQRDRSFALSPGAQLRDAYGNLLAENTNVRRTESQQQTPPDIVKWNTYKNLSPEEQALYDRMNRGNQGYSSTTEKAIFDASDAYVEDNAAYENYVDLANRYELSQGKLLSGIVGSISDWLKEQTGNQDELTLLRKDWSRIKASELVKNLPPGAASDADIDLAKKGFLPDNAEPKTVASFLRGVAKLRKLNAEYNSFKADYLSEKKNPGGLRQAWQDRAKQLNIGGSTVSASQYVQQPETNSKGWILQQDAQGNKAYVGPNGEIEEVQ